MKRSLLALMIVLAACSQETEEPEPVPLTIEVAGDPGEPAVSIVDGDLPEESTQIVDIDGNGRELAADSPVLYTVSSFDDDRQLLASSETPILTVAGEMPIEAVGLNEGSRILVVNPQEGGAEILVYDILHTVVRGETRETSDFSITTAEDGIPSLEGTGEVDSLSTQIIIRGTGPQVDLEDELYVQYSLYGAEDGEVLDSTWEQGPILLQLEETFEGLRTGVAELPVGSRLLITIPAGQAQGTEDLVVIIDILALG